MRAARSDCGSCARSSTSSKATDTSAPDRPAGGLDPRSLGVLGGTFNPPHLGHLAVVRHALGELELERVLLMPAHTPPHKSPGEDPGPEHRLRMCELAVEGIDRLAACPLELERGGASYTVDTLRAIHKSHPEAELTFILGADTARTIDSWREPAALLVQARIAVAMRDGSPRGEVLDTVRRVLAGAPGGEQAGERVSFLEMAPIEISSSSVRARVARGEPIERLVGAPVAGYIAEHGLYRGGAEVQEEVGA